MHMRDASRKNWTSNDTNEHINLGSFQRIADACEKMAGNYTELQNQRDYYKRLYEQEKKTSYSLYRSNCSLRGTITKLKKKVARE